MFAKNTTHLQQSLFGLDSQLPDSKRKKLYQSKEFLFYNLIFCNIKEEDFAPLFSANGSRPNAPVNSLVCAAILLNHNGWTIEELFTRIDFDLLTRTALGLTNIEDTPFCQATYFNFQNRLASYYGKTGVNPFENVFDHLTEKQLKDLKIKTDIQRMDSFQAMSNIRSCSRVQLLVEVLIRLHRILTEEDQLQCNELLSLYCAVTSSKYVYGLKHAELPHELEKLAAVYHQLYILLHSDYSETEAFKIFERVYNEHFTVVEDKISINKMHSGVLQSPDDLDATFREKSGKRFRGEVVNVAETANPENKINLITDVAVRPNNIDDSIILNERLDIIVAKTPDLIELHTDGGYGSSANDIIMEKEEITHVQTAVRGRESAVDMLIDRDGDGVYEVTCPYQTTKAESTKTRYKATFDENKCKECIHAGNCPAITQKSGRVYYFDEEMARQSKRVRNIVTIPKERMKLRPNVEATMKEFTIPFNHKGKLRVRGLFKIMVYAFTRAIAINFGRIFRLRRRNPDFNTFQGVVLAYLGIVVETVWAWIAKLIMRNDKKCPFYSNLPCVNCFEKWAF
jgi:hypothetical protein